MKLSLRVDLLFKYLLSICTLSPAFQTELRKRLREEHYRSKHIFHSQGQAEYRLWYIAQGFVRAYYFDQEGKEHTLCFYQEKEMIFSRSGYWKETSDYYIEAIENTTLYSLAYTELRELSEHYPETQTLMEVFSRRSFHQEIFRSRLLTWSAEERYKQLRKVEPTLFKRASVRLLATYLNMSRENLSRLMAKR
jgi:CRP-like cAMP-binding protein